MKNCSVPTSAIRVLGLLLACFVMMYPARSRAQTAPALPDDVDITAQSLELDPKTNILIGRGGVTIKMGVDSILTADEVQYDLNSGAVTAVGGVKVVSKDMAWQGDSIRGNLKDKSFDFDSFTASFNRWKAKGSSASRGTDGTLDGRNVSLTACDDWWLQTRHFVHHPDGSFKAYGVIYRVHGVPLFYLPYLAGNTNWLNNAAQIEIGSKADWGFYITISKSWRLTPNIDSRFFVEYRMKRGLALGNESQFRTRRTVTNSLVYGMRDKAPRFDTRIGNEKYNTRFKTEDTRYRLRLDHRGDYLADDRLTVRGNLDLRSDNDLLFEFFTDEYNLNPQPTTMGDVTYQEERWALSGYARLRLNDYESAVERLPEIRFDMPRQGIPGTRLEYQSQTTLAYLRMRWSDYDLARTDGLADAQDYESLRFDSLHMFYLPFQFGIARVVPRVGGRLTYYDESSEKSVSNSELNSTFAAMAQRAGADVAAAPVNFDSDGGGVLRLAGEFGVEASTKYYRTWTGTKNDLLQINGLRHVVEPYVNYTYIPSPSEDKENLLYFDSIDRIEKADFVRLGVKQRWQTRRRKQIYTFAKLETFADFHVESEDGGDHLGDFGVIGETNPRDNVSLWAKTLFNMGDGDLNVFNTGITVGNRRKTWASLSYLYRNEYTSRYAYSMGSDLAQIMNTGSVPLEYGKTHNLDIHFGFPITARDRAEISYLFDLQSGGLARQRYEWQHDLRCWIIGMRAQEENGNVSVMLVLYLKGLSNFKSSGPAYDGG